MNDLTSLNKHSTIGPQINNCSLKLKLKIMPQQLTKKKTTPKPLKIIFLQGDYPATPKSNPYFGRGGRIHKLVTKSVKTKVCWHFVGGFIDEHRHDFWKKIEQADAFFTTPMNMDHEDIHMHWDHASASMFEVLSRIKRLNPKIKVIFYYWDSEMATELEKHGKLLSDLHDAKEIKSCFKK